jgi:hypothetical protein
VTANRRSAAAALLLALGCGKVHAPESAPRADVVTSNTLRSDFAGSKACRDCHAEIWQSWLGSPMHRMTRDAASSEIRAPFDGRELSFKNDVARLEQHDGRRYIKLSAADGGTRHYLVTKVIGGRYREDFAGIEVAGTRPGAQTSGDERVLPVSYLIFDKSLRYKGYSVMSPERPALRPGARWRTTCIFCHNTVPAFSALLDELHGEGAPVYQGSASFELPEARRFRFEIGDEPALERAVAAELRVLGWDAPPESLAAKGLLGAAIVATQKRFGESHLIELGVGCESCHGGAREHVRDPSRKPSFELKSDFFTVAAPGGRAPTHAQDVNRTCAKCHTVLFTRYPHTWEGKRRNHDPGGSHINSGEARDFLLGACSSKLHCASCHDPHGKRGQTGAEAATAAADAVCARCHASQAAPERRAAHTHHAPGSEGSRCVNCHMPRKNMGLAYDLVRYHRIGSPTDRERVEGDRPLECALCHADRSVETLVVTMERWWGKRYNRRALHELYGPSLRVGALDATLSRGKPHEQAVAIAVIGSQRLVPRAPLLVEALDNEYPLVRFYAKAALERVLGAPPPIDWHAPGPELVEQGRLWLETQR